MTISRRGGLVLGLSAPFLRAGSGWAQAPAQPVARPPAGDLLGVPEDQVLSFKGIPYATAPTGPLRFRSPRKAPRWTGVRDATRPGAASIQTIPPWAAWLYDRPAAMSEDCLFLNVWTPALEGRRPVMVWLHGGAWRTGEGAAAGNDGRHLARLGDVVVVTVNYRLGALGFLSHPALADPDTGAVANWGVQDQVAALEWVRDNIAAFGGDPANVTLFGQSAGGTSTANIAQNPRSRALVSKLIIQSGSLMGPPGLPDLPAAAAYAETLAGTLQVPVAALHSIEATRLHAAELALARSWDRGPAPILPVTDGQVVAVPARDAPLPPLPLLIGSTRNEAVFWYDGRTPDGERIPGLAPPADATALDRMTRAQERSSLSAGHVPVADPIAAYARAESPPGGGTVQAAWLAIYTDLRFRLTAVRTARAHASAGHAAFLYEYAHPLAGKAWGSPHCSDIPFVFGTHTDPYFAAKCGTGPAETALARTMMQSWTSFARTGTPASEAEGEWVRVSAGGEGINVLGDGVPRKVVPRLREEELAAWTA